MGRQFQFASFGIKGMTNQYRAVVGMAIFFALCCVCDLVGPRGPFEGPSNWDVDDATSPQQQAADTCIDRTGLVQNGAHGAHQPENDKNTGGEPVEEAHELAWVGELLVALDQTKEEVDSLRAEKRQLDVRTALLSVQSAEDDSLLAVARDGLVEALAAQQMLERSAARRESELVWVEAKSRDQATVLARAEGKLEALEAELLRVWETVEQAEADQSRQAAAIKAEYDKKGLNTKQLRLCLSLAEERAQVAAELEEENNELRTEVDALRDWASKQNQSQTQLYPPQLVSSRYEMGTALERLAAALGMTYPNSNGTLTAAADAMHILAAAATTVTHTQTLELQLNASLAEKENITTPTRKKSMLYLADFWLIENSIFDDFRVTAEEYTMYYLTGPRSYLVEFPDDPPNFEILDSNRDGHITFKEWQQSLICQQLKRHSGLLTFMGMCTQETDTAPNFIDKKHFSLFIRAFMEVTYPKYAPVEDTFDDTFNGLDTNLDNHISVDEWEVMLSRTRFDFDSIEGTVSQFWEADASGDARVTRSEYNAYTKALIKAFPEDSAKDYPDFNDFDTNRSGTISLEEWRQYVIRGWEEAERKHNLEEE